MKTARASRLKNKSFILSEDKNKYKINPKQIYDIYKNEFIDECDSIIIEKQKDFLQKYFNKIHLIIKNEYGNEIFEEYSQMNDIIKKCEIDFTNEVYNPMYNSCLFGLRKYNSTKVHNIAKEYLTNFLPHCSYDQVPLHTCGSKFIYINNIIKNKKLNGNGYVLCIGCHKCYYDSCIKMYCPYCQMKFYSHLIEKNKDNIYPATWKKYHCDDYMNNEQMTCIKCEGNFWVKDDILICKNCKLEVNPEAIIWTCIVCKQEFKSGVKIYNELEFKEINYEIKNALLYKKITKPYSLPCKCLSLEQINNVDFNHKPNGGCKGVLYYGVVDNREFVVCSLCKQMSYLNKFLWNCPICKKSFTTKKVKCYIHNNYNNTSTNKITYKNSDVRINDNSLANKGKKSKQNFYSHIPSLSINNTGQRDIRKNNSYKRKCIEITNNSKENVCTETNQNDKRRNNSLIIKNRNNSILNSENNNNKVNINNNCDSNASQGCYHLIQENKNTSGSSTVYSSVLYINSSREKEKEKDKEKEKETNNKRTIEQNNSAFKFNYSILNKIMDKKDISFTKTNDNKKYNLSLSNKKEDIYVINKKNSSNNNITNNSSNYIYEYNNCNKKETISSINLRRGTNNNKNIITLNKSINNNNNNTGIMKNKVYVPKKNFNSSNMNITTANDEEKNNNNYNRLYRNRLKINNNDSQESNKYRNYSGPKVNNENSNIYINSKYRDALKVNNYNNHLEIRNSSQPKTDLNKYNIRRNKMINIEDNVQKANLSNISNMSDNYINNNSIYEENKGKNNNNNKLYNMKTKEYYYRRGRRNDENLITNNSGIKNNSNRRKDEKIKNNEIKCFDNALDIRKNIKIRNSLNLNTSNNEEDKDKDKENKDKDKDNDELKEFNFNDYKIITQLGQGTIGKIYLVQDPSNQLFSMKKIVLSEELDVQTVIKEYRMCYKIKHPNVIKILGIYNNQLDKTTYVVYVLMEVGLTDWEKEIKKYNDKHMQYSEADLINIIKQLTSVLAFLQRKNIIHRDIKPQNILVFKNNIYKIADFGEAKQIDRISKSMVVNSLRGTELYMSPLLFNGLRNGQVDIKHNMFKSDVYSFGLSILYAAATSNKPLYDTRKFVEMTSVKKYINKLLRNKYSNKFIDLLCTMIEIHEKKRPDFIELENIMKNWK